MRTDAEQPRRRRIATGLKLAVTFVLCGTLYAAADWQTVAAQLVTLDLRWFIPALALFVPQTLVSAWRWLHCIAPWHGLTLIEATTHTLIGSAWNLIVPSKLGDFSKAALAVGGDVTQRKRLAGCVAVEKAADLAALGIATFVGLYAPPVAGMLVILAFALVAYEAERRLRARGRRIHIFACTVGTALLWTLHLSQIHFFLLAARVEADLTTSLARVPAALLAGLVPAAFCGIGTRDAALVWLFADVASPAAMAVVGLLTALRYVVPGVAGIPLLWARHRTKARTSSMLFRLQPINSPVVAAPLDR